MNGSWVEVLVGLLRLQRGPQDLPYSPGFLGALVVAAVVFDHLTARLLGVDGDGFLARAALTVITGLGLPYLVLRITRRATRFVKTASALVATSLMFAVLVVPVIAVVGPLPEDAAQLSLGQMLFGWPSLALLGWKLAVHGNIFRHALEIPLHQGVLLAVALLLAELAAGAMLVVAGVSGSVSS